MYTHTLKYLTQSYDLDKSHLENKYFNSYLRRLLFYVIHVCDFCFQVEMLFNQWLNIRHILRLRQLIHHPTS